MSIYLDGKDQDEWRALPSAKPHEIYGLVMGKAGTYHGSIEEHRRIGAFDVVLEMDVDPVEDCDHAARPFYEQIYASRHTITLV